MKPEIPYLSFHIAFTGYKLYNKETGAYVSKHIPYWCGLSIEETKAKYNLEPFKKQSWK